MAPRFADRLYHAYNVFMGRDQNDQLRQAGSMSYGESFGIRPDRPRLRSSNERSIIASMYARIAIDVASVDILHVKLDDNKRYLETITSGLNNCLDLEANIDQAGQQFKIDVAMNLFDKGVLAIVPTDTTLNPRMTGSYDILSMRVGEIVGWMPRHVRVNLYNDRTGQREDVVVAKTEVAIIENPMFTVMNEPNSTLQRLIRKLNLLDAVDEASASGKLDLIIQLPYQIKSDLRREQAEQRRKDIEFQLKEGAYGIAYMDSTEKVTQLNRPVDNNLLSQIEYLMKMLYSQLGLTEGIFDGTASEAEMLNYHMRTLRPILRAITQAMKRNFLTKTARTQGQSIEFFRNPFDLVPVSNLAEIADKFTRNEILTANEIRAIIGFRPHEDPKANELINSNMPADKRGGDAMSPAELTT